MRITKWGEYGVLFAMHLGRLSGEKPAGATEIAASARVDVQYAHQVLQRLRKGGIVRSVRGVQGGYRLTRPPEQITLLELLIAAEGDTFEIICEHHPVFPGATADTPCHADQSCALGRVWRSLKREIDDLLERRTLASLIEGNSSHVQENPVLSIGERRRSV